MSAPLTNEQLNREIENIKIEELELEIIEDKYSNDFSILEEDYYEKQDREYKQELKNQFVGFSIVNLLTQ